MTGRPLTLRGDGQDLQMGERQLKAALDLARRYGWKHPSMTLRLDGDAIETDGLRFTPAQAGRFGRALEEAFGVVPECEGYDLGYPFCEFSGGAKNDLRDIILFCRESEG